jgi:hypothetical protein
MMIAALAGCGSTDGPAPVAQGTRALFDLGADLGDAAHFYDFPYPSDLRLSAEGTPDLRGFPDPDQVPIVEGLRVIAEQRPGFPVMPVAYFRFTAPPAPQDIQNVVAPEDSAPAMLVDVDPGSPERGRRYPVVLATPNPDDYVAENVLIVAPRPGFALAPGRKYAFVVRRGLKDAAGKLLEQPAALGDLLAGRAAAGAKGEAAKALYAPLAETLKTLGVDAADVAAATVFTTGDVVDALGKLSDAVLKKYSLKITDLALDPDDGKDHERFCELHGKVVYPQFQKGKPPFETDGLFEMGPDGLPVEQRTEVAPIAISIPKTAMPAGGYPLAMYFHGSGGLSTQVIDRGRVTVMGGEPEKGKGPAHVLGAFGIAMAGSALPLNPERLPGASETEYLNLDNLAAFRDTFRQGVIEERLFMAALKDLVIDPAVLAGCTGPSLPANETGYRFAPEKLVAMGQSMGGMYTNMIGATEPRIRAVVPTGAGGFWSYFMLVTSLIPNLSGAVGLVLGTHEKLTFAHPALHLLETAWEPAEPLAYMPRLGKRPLEGHPVRPIYEPVGKDDSYFPTPLYDAVALAYGHREAGEAVWPTMQEALALDGLSGMLPYPVQDDVKSVDGTAYTGVVVQYAGDGIYDPHSIFSQLDDVKYQYGCFLSVFLEKGVARVPAPAALGTPCP